MTDRINDPKNLLGMSDIIGAGIDDDDIDLQQLEQAIIHGTKVPDKEPSNIAKDFNAELEKISRQLQQYPSGAGSGGGFPLHPSNNGLSGGGFRGGANTSGSGSNGAPRSAPDDESDSDDEPETTHVVTPAAKEPKWRDAQLARYTEEERRQSQIDRALDDMDTQQESRNLLDQEDEEDELARIMEQADMLREYLRSQNPKLVERVPEIQPDTPMRDARIILKTLQRKNDSLRSVDMFEEGMLSIAYGVEQIFDGKREIFGFKIDLTGWSDTLKVKLKRMRYHTGAFIKEIMHDYDINHGWYIVLEILPSMLLYTKDRRTQNKDTLMNDERYRSVLGEIRN